MQNSDEDLAARERVPGWVVQLARFGLMDSFINHPPEFTKWCLLAQQDGVPPYIAALRTIRDLYNIEPTTTLETVVHAIKSKRQKRRQNPECYQQRW